jgi:hypothetical protein
MIRTGALPLGQQIALDLFAPPLITAVWWLLSGGWSGLLGTTESEVVKGWRKPAVWTVLIVCYVLMFGTTAYAYFF